ncbi:acetyl-CoA C-acyltransferase [Gammaproteobacteria bacterium]|nr:acetyl-CoA C-acyltransferase [Gammaproteobacteria bacterium]
MKPVYILESVRTPRAKAKESGGLHDLNPFELLDSLYKFYSTNAIVDPDNLEEVILGCVTQYGEQAGNIAKSSALYSQYPDHVSGLSINRFCSSSLDAINIGYLKIASGQNNIIMAGGIEMMSRVPMLSDKAAIWTNVNIAKKSRIFMMGSGADLIASVNKISRLDADTQALSSQKKAVYAQKNGHFKSIVPVFNPQKDFVCAEDECIRAETTMENLSSLNPSFEELGKNGVDALQLKYFPQLSEIVHIHTAGNSPAMSDAASITLLSSSSSSASSDYRSRGIIKAVSVVSANPLLVLSGCIEATKQLLIKNNLTINDIDLFEIHEAFASTIILAQRELNIPENKLNVNGGCIALGHPMGATGSIMLSSLLDEMERQDLDLGIVATSGAAGVGTALLIQR